MFDRQGLFDRRGVVRHPSPTSRMGRNVGDIGAMHNGVFVLSYMGLALRRPDSGTFAQVRYAAIAQQRCDCGLARAFNWRCREGARILAEAGLMQAEWQ